MSFPSSVSNTTRLVVSTCVTFGVCRYSDFAGHGREANQHGGVDCLLSNGWIGCVRGVILSDHVGGDWQSFPVAGGLVCISPVVLGEVMFCVAYVL